MKTADKLLRAADELFGERGYDGVSVADVAEAAGVRKALVFYHHQSKEVLFERVLARYYEAHRIALEGAIDPDAPLPERLHRLVDRYLDFIASNGRYARMVQRQVCSGADLPIVRTSLGALLASVEHALEGVTPESGPLAARHFFVTFSGAVINYFTYGPALQEAWGGDPLAEEAVAERRAHLHWVVDTLVRGLAAESGEDRA